MLNGEPFDSPVYLHEPEEYEVKFNDKLIRFQIKEPVILVIQRVEETPRILVQPESNHWWMIPASWMGLFLLKKLQD